MLPIIPDKNTSSIRDSQHSIGGCAPTLKMLLHLMRKGIARAPGQGVANFPQDFKRFPLCFIRGIGTSFVCNVFGVFGISIESDTV